MLEWISTTGGPLILLPKSLLSSWKMSPSPCRSKTTISARAESGMTSVSFRSVMEKHLSSPKRFLRRLGNHCLTAAF